MDSVPLISSLDASQFPPPFPDQMVIKTQTEYQLSSPEQLKKLPDLEAQKLHCSHHEDGHKHLPTARTVAFVMALLGCLLIMYKAIWYDQFSCPDGFLLRQRKLCSPLTLEMYYTEMDPERHRSVLAAIGAYPLTRRHGTPIPLPWSSEYRLPKLGSKPPTDEVKAKAKARVGAAATEGPPKPAPAAAEEAGSPAPPQ
ncbi:neuron-specific vesicular protein calcyon [Erinaceus europaeus]|uniref:Neuron-specific vesicular protein calcyon n=1 Tax=Erinaceus europaeus TaxID=9365 RepID=A0A1S3WQ44_ERIEU|nr:neuron-specific vesicular protein calcyon [Erinaceus europaeus]